MTAISMVGKCERSCFGTSTDPSWRKSCIWLQEVVRYNEFVFSVRVSVISGRVLGPDGRFGGRRVSDGFGVYLPRSWMWRRGYSTCGVT